MTEYTMSRVEIKDTLTGDTAVSHELNDQTFDAYWWAEGDAACDCNRFLFFMRAKGYALSEDDEDHSCHHGTPRFRVCVYGEADTLLFNDTQDANAPWVVREI